MEKEIKRGTRRRRNGMMYRNMAGIFCAVIVLLMIISIIIPDKDYSEEENRVLTEFPDFSWENIMNKDFMTGLEDYVADHFVFRDFWINMKTKCDLLIGKREFNGVYLGDDGYLMQIPMDPDVEMLNSNLESINQFAETYADLDINMMVIPNAVSVMESYLPAGAPVRDQQEDAEYIQEMLTGNIDYIETAAVLGEHVEEGMYYKTDHHWTSDAAYYTFLSTAEQLGIEEPITDYDVYTVTTEFSGTLASKTGYHEEEDTIKIYAPSGKEIDYLVSNGDGEIISTIYDKSALNEKDKYQVFFGGNQAKTEISMVNQTREKLLIFKDSYANCFIPFLLPYYNEIIVVDPRYYYDNVHTLIQSEQITDVLFLYNLDTFLNDNSIAGVLAE